MSEPVTAPDQSRSFPAAAGILFGLGLGGFFDGIVLHQVLQWHHMLSNWYPVNTLENLRLNTAWDGIFHSLTYLFVVGGLYLSWRAAQSHRLLWSNRRFVGLLLLGWGIFNVIEGIIDHELLGLHHVNEAVPDDQRLYWDVGFLCWGMAMILVGWLLTRSRRFAGVVSRPL